MFKQSLLATALLAVALSASAFAAPPSAGNKSRAAQKAAAPPQAPSDAQLSPGLAAHYYRDHDFWDGIWPDTVPVPVAVSANYTFTNYRYTRVEPVINHLFTMHGWVSVRWKGYLTIPAAEDPNRAFNYTFLLLADDGCRLFIDGQKLTDDWRPCAENSRGAVRTATMALTPGPHALVVEYFNGQSLGAEDYDPCKLSWKCAERSLEAQAIPDAQFSHTEEDLTATAGRLDSAAP